MVRLGMLFLIFFSSFFLFAHTVNADVSGAAGSLDWGVLEGILGERVMGWVNAGMVWLGIVIALLSIMQQMPIKAMRERKEKLSKLERGIQKIVSWGPTVGESQVDKKKE